MNDNISSHFAAWGISKDHVLVPTNLNYKVSKHFSYGELIKSQTAIRNNIKNIPSLDQYKALHALCNNVMEPVRSIYDVPVIVSSGLRVLKLNKKIGSWDGSQHVKGEAIDFELLGNNHSLHDLWRSIVLSDNIPFDQCILEFPPDGWIHISHSLTGHQRGKISIARKEDGNTKYTHYTRQQIIDFEYDYE